MDNLGIQEHGNLPRTAPRSGGSSERAGRADLYCAGTLFALDELCLTTVVAVVEVDEHCVQGPAVETQLGARMWGGVENRVRRA